MTTSNTVEVVIRIHNVDPDDPIELIQDETMNALYAYGFKAVEPIRASLVEDEDYRAC